MIRVWSRFAQPQFVFVLFRILIFFEEIDNVEFDEVKD